MKALTDFAREDGEFAGVDFVEANPDAPADVPRIVWKLRSRVAGNGTNSKNPFYAERVSLDDGRVLSKYVFPQRYEVAFEALGATPEEADRLRDALELWLMLHRPQAAQAGLESLMFLSEQEPDVVATVDSQKIHRRTLLYHGVINYLYPRIEDPIQGIRSWRVGEATFQTASIVRSPGDTDLSSIPGPLVLCSLHDSEGKTTPDYLFGTDYSVIVDRERFEALFQIRWLPRGKRPELGATYFLTYAKAVGTQTVLDSGIPAPPGRYRRLPPGTLPSSIPRVLGAQTDGQAQGLLFPVLGPSQAGTGDADLRDALFRAQTELIVVAQPPD